MNSRFVERNGKTVCKGETGNSRLNYRSKKTERLRRGVKNSPEHKERKNVGQEVTQND